MANKSYQVFSDNTTSWVPHYVKLIDNRDGTYSVNVGSEESNPLAVESAIDKGADNAVSFQYSSVFDMPKDTTAYLLGRTNGKLCNFIGYDIKSNYGRIDINFYENPIISLDGTKVDGVAKNRDVDCSATLQIFTGTTLISNGGLISQDIIYEDDNGNKPTLSTGGIFSKFILKSDTDYLFEIKNLSSQTATIRALFEWYEKDKNLAFDPYTYSFIEDSGGAIISDINNNLIEVRN
jgi:hypothetical protein